METDFVNFARDRVLRDNLNCIETERVTVYILDIHDCKIVKIFSRKSFVKRHFVSELTRY